MVELLLQTMASYIPESTPLQMGPAGTGMSAYPTNSSTLLQNRRPPGLDPRLGYSRLYSTNPPSTTTATPNAAPMLMNSVGGVIDDATAGAGGLSTNSFGVNATDGEGRTALHWAAVTEQPAMVQLLLRAGASHDVQTLHEETPLTLAAREGSIEACSLLLAAGANIDIADYLDRTPRQLAAQNGHAEVVQLLQIYSSNPQPPHPNPPQPQQQHYVRRAASYSQNAFFQQQQQQQQATPNPPRYYRPLPQASLGGVYSDGQSYEKRTKYEPSADYSLCGGEEGSFLMQLAPSTTTTTTTSTCSGGGVKVVAAKIEGEEAGLSAATTTATTSSKAYFFDQPPPSQFTSAAAACGDGGVDSVGQGWTGPRDQTAMPAAMNGHTPSSDTESPTHWSSPSPTAISPPLAPPKMTVANSGGQYHPQAVVRGGAGNNQGVFCSTGGHYAGYTAATRQSANPSGAFTVSYAPDDCIKLEPRVF